MYQRYLAPLLLMLLMTVLLAAVPPSARGQQQSQEPNNDVIRFGADARGGAPYCFPDRENPRLVRGSDVDVIHAVAARLGKKAVFVQNSWDGLIQGLGRSNYDVVIDGIVITDERSENVEFSIPYYVTHQQIVVRVDEEGVDDLNDLRGRPVGTLANSEAYQLLTKHGGIDVRSYEHEVDGYQDLSNERIDAFVIDAPVALYYVPTINGLKMVGQPIGRLEYGIVVEKGNRALLDQINAAIMEMRASGELRTILERWNLWNELVADTFGDRVKRGFEPSEYYRFLRGVRRDLSFGEKLERYMGFLPMFAEAAMMTLWVSVVSMMVAMVVGLILAILRLSAPRPLKYLAVGYIELVRGTPLLIQMLFIFYGLPNVGLKLSPFVAGVLALGLNYAAYEAENYRAGLRSVPRGQMEAALALGMSRWQALRYVVGPQAVRLVIPPVTNDFISLLKDSSLVSMITLVELTQTYNLLASTYYDHFGIGIEVALVYFFIGLPFVILSRYAERRFATDTRGVRPRLL